MAATEKQITDMAAKALGIVETMGGKSDVSADKAYLYTEFALAQYFHETHRRDISKSGRPILVRIVAHDLVLAASRDGLLTYEANEAQSSSGAIKQVTTLDTTVVYDNQSAGDQQAVKKDAYLYALQMERESLWRRLIANDRKLVGFR